MAETAKLNPVRELLHKTKVGSIVDEERKVMSVSDKGSVEDAVAVLGKNRIQSLPVLSGKECKGMVDMLDILAYVMSVAPSDRELEANELSSLDIAGRAIAVVPLEQVMDFSGRDPLVPIHRESPLTQVTELFANGVHHAVLFTKDELSVENMLTGSDVVKFLMANAMRGECKAMAGMKSADLGLGVVAPRKLNKNKTVLDALRKMKKHGVSSLAIVDEGKLVGNFSASDLVGLYKGSFPKFLSSMEDFLKEFSPKSLNPITSSSDATFLQILQQLAENHLHHTWIVDADGKPTGIISITDICRAIHSFKYY